MPLKSHAPSWPWMVCSLISGKKRWAAGGSGMAAASVGVGANVWAQAEQSLRMNLQLSPESCSP